MRSRAWSLGLSENVLENGIVKDMKWCLEMVMSLSSKRMCKQFMQKTCVTTIQRQIAKYGTKSFNDFLEFE